MVREQTLYDFSVLKFVDTWFLDQDRVNFSKYFYLPESILHLLDIKFSIYYGKFVNSAVPILIYSHCFLFFNPAHFISFWKSCFESLICRLWMFIYAVLPLFALYIWGHMDRNLELVHLQVNWTLKKNSF